jgi:hypothetical protein
MMPFFQLIQMVALDIHLVALDNRLDKNGILLVYRSVLPLSFTHFLDQ